ncbi:MAG: tetratricopeptide repeat protein [Pyrinomonadaceae bacterium]|nr:tetratricopeptide repeat protein [Pyrinomonadaceae bacterium]
MRVGLKELRLLLFVVVFLTVPTAAFSQDLGSTSGLFGKKAVKKKAPVKKKSSSKKKSTRPKKRSASRRSTSRSKRSSTRKKKPTSAATSAKSGNTTTKEQPQIATSRLPKEDVVITVGQNTAPVSSVRFEDAIADGNAARNRRLYGDAESAYLTARSIDPEDSRAIYGLGNVFADQMRWEEAEAAYRKALAIEPENPLANIALSYVLTQPVVGSNLGERYAEAEKKAQRAIKLDPENAIGYDQLGVAKELRGIISVETEKAYKQAISLDPTFALAYAHLGRLLRKQGRTGESAGAYRESIRLASDVPTMILVANVMQSQQRYLDSEQLLREALRRDPRNPTGLYLLGRALTFRKSFAEAEEVIKKGIEVSPKSFVAYALLGSLYIQDGDPQRAEQALMKALAVVSDNEKRRLAQEFELVGDAFLEAGKQADAARMYRRAVELDASKESLPSKLARTESVN